MVSVQGSSFVMCASDLHCCKQSKSQWLEDNGDDTVFFSKSTAFHGLGNLSDQMGKTNVGICACVYMCAQACACVFMFMCLCVCVWTTLGIISQVLSTCVVRQGLSLAWSRPSRLGWLASDFQGSICLCLSNAGRTCTYHCTWIFHISSRDQTQVPAFSLFCFWLSCLWSSVFEMF